MIDTDARRRYDLYLILTIVLLLFSCIILFINCSLDVSCCSQLSERAILSLAIEGSNLRELDMMGCGFNTPDKSDSSNKNNYRNENDKNASAEAIQCLQRTVPALAATYIC